MNAVAVVSGEFTGVLIDVRARWRCVRRGLAALSLSRHRPVQVGDGRGTRICGDCGRPMVGG